MPSGGGRGIRTLGYIPASHDFESCALNQAQPSLLAEADGNLVSLDLTSLLFAQIAAWAVLRQVRQQRVQQAMVRPRANPHHTPTARHCKKLERMTAMGMPKSQ